MLRWSDSLPDELTPAGESERVRLFGACLFLGDFVSRFANGNENLPLFHIHVFFLIIATFLFSLGAKIRNEDV